MTQNPADEPPIDTSLAYYMEGRALDIALEKADAPEVLAGLQRLLASRATLMHQRDAFAREAIAMRHARGEVYSSARVAAINAIGPGGAEMEVNAKTLYQRQSDAWGVLKAHARVHFVYALMSSRLLLAVHEDNIREAAHRMQAREEDFACAWLNTLNDAAFSSEIRQLQRAALATLRTAGRPMFLVSDPATQNLGDADALALGKAWNKLDALAKNVNLEPLSTFIAVPGEHPSTGAPADQVLCVVQALLEVLRSPGCKIPAKRATVAALERVRDALEVLRVQHGRVMFEVDI